MADDVAILQSGVVVQHGPPMSVYSRPATAEVASFLGDSMLLEATSDGTYVTSAVGSVRVSGADLGDGHLMLRPEQLVILPRGGGGVPGEVVSTQFFGHDAMVTVAVDAGETLLRSRVLGAPLHLTPGTEVSVFVKGEATYFADRARPATVPSMMRG